MERASMAGTSPLASKLTGSARNRHKAELLDYPRRVLLVEPSPSESSRLRNVLVTAQIEVHAVSDLITALHVVSTYHPDLILAQMRLHAHSGLELVCRVKENCSTALLPVILYSDSATAEQRVKAFDQGVADFLCKPFAGAELVARVQAALKVRHMMTLLEQRAHVDSLTGLANRGVFEDQLLREWEACHRQNAALSVVIVDLDHFKGINDKHGHMAGDEVLRRSAHVLARSVRRSDLVARYGGEEFVVIAPRCSLAAAVNLAKRFRSGLAEQMVSAHATIIPVTASVGIAAADWEADTPKELLRRADEALYQAKLSGRNAIWVHDPSRNGLKVAVSSGTAAVVR
jgi:two-component system cell cycle response regulator